MELEIVGAVLATLALVFAGVSTQLDLDASDGSPLSSIDLSLDILDELTSPPEPENPVTMEVEADYSLELASERAEPEGLTQLPEIESDTPIGLKGFRGSITTVNETRLRGEASGFYTENVETNTSVRLDREVDGEVQFLETERSGYSFNASEFVLSYSDGELSESDVQVEIESFEGDLVARPDERMLEFDGNISEVEAGEISYGG